MAAIGPTTEIVFESTHTSLVGRNQEVTCDMVRTRLDEIAQQVQLLYPHIEMPDLTSIKEPIVQEFINEREKNLLQIKQLGIEPKKRIEIIHNHSSRKSSHIETKAHYTIYEESEKVYESEEDKKTWKDRVALIKQLLSMSEIFSLSIVPSNEMEMQTLYHKRTLKRTEHILPDEQEIYRLFFAKHNTKTDPESPSETTLIMDGKEAVSSDLAKRMIDGCPPDKIDEFAAAIESLFEPHPENSTKPYYSDGKRSETKSNIPENRTFPAPQLTGFFAPFSGFSSSLAKPQYHPDRLPASVRKANVFADKEVAQLLRGLENDPIREKMAHIITLFQQDIHSNGLGIMLLEPSRKQVKPIFLTKSIPL